MLLAVLDDTGTHDGAEYCSCIGAVSGVQPWRRFDREWKRELRRFGVEEFHARRFFARDSEGNRVPPYRGWSDEKALDFLDSMTSLFRAMKAGIVGSAVETKVFFDLPEVERAFWTGQVIHQETGQRLGTGAPNKPFIFAFAVALVWALDFGRSRTTLGVVLDQSDSLAPQAASMCAQATNVPRYLGLVRGFHPASRKEFLPLQLADLAAWLWNRYLTKGDLTDEQNFAMERISKKGAGIKLLNAEGLYALKENHPDLVAMIQRLSDG